VLFLEVFAELEREQVLANSSRNASKSGVMGGLIRIPANNCTNSTRFCAAINPG
jgi:hypothetical protein